MLLVVRTSLVPAFFLFPIPVDLLLPLVVFLGFQRPFAAGVMATLLLGGMADALSGGGTGFHAVSYLVCFFASQFLASQLLLRGVLLEMLLAGLGLVLGGLAVAAAGRMVGVEAPPLSGGLLGNASATGLLAPLLLWPVRALDKRLRGRKEPWMVRPLLPR